MNPYDDELRAINEALVKLMARHDASVPRNDNERRSLADAIDHLATARALLGGEHQEDEDE